MTLSRRAEGIGESATLRVARRAMELRAEGVEIVSLGAGEPDFRSPRAAEDAAVAALRDGFTRYTPVAGIPELRREIARLYAEREQAPWETDQVVVTVGAKAALFQLMLALVEEGDEVVVPVPYWVSYPEQIRFCGGEPVWVETRPEEGFRLRSEAVLGALGERTRAVLINSPSNPTGAVVAADDLAAIVAGCAERGVLVVADETYDRFVYDRRRFPSAARLAARHPETVVLVGSFSKTYAMTGWRLGYLLGPRPLVAAVAAIQSHATSNPTSFAMKGAVAALRHGEDEVRAMIAEYQRRRDLVIEGLAGIQGVVCTPPEGAFYAFPDVGALYREDCDGSVALAEFLLETARVAVVPGIAFGADRHVRLSFACSAETLSTGLERMATALADRAAVG